MEFASWGPQICPTSKTHKMLLLAIELLSRPSAGEENPGICRIARWLVGRATSSTRTRRGGSCLKDIYKTFLIYRTCMRRAPAKPVRACTLRKWCLVSHVTFEAPLRTSHFSLQSSHSTLHTSHSTLHTALFTLHPSQSTLHFTLYS